MAVLYLLYCTVLYCTVLCCTGTVLAGLYYTVLVTAAGGVVEARLDAGESSAGTSVHCGVVRWTEDVKSPSRQADSPAWSSRPVLPCCLSGFPGHREPVVLPRLRRLVVTWLPTWTGQAGQDSQ